MVGSDMLTCKCLIFDFEEILFIDVTCIIDKLNFFK